MLRCEKIKKSTCINFTAKIKRIYAYSLIYLLRAESRRDSTSAAVQLWQQTEQCLQSFLHFVSLSARPAHIPQPAVVILSNPKTFFEEAESTGVIFTRGSVSRTAGSRADLTLVGGPRLTRGLNE